MNNDLCDTDKWSVIKGTWVYTDNDGSCSLYNSDNADGNVIWFGSADGLTYDGDYNYTSFILECTMVVVDSSNNGGHVCASFNCVLLLITNECCLSYMWLFFPIEMRA